MLVTLKEVTQDALKNHYAVGAYNIHNLEYAKAVVETSYEMKAPVILQISQGSSDFAGLEELCMIARHYAGKYAIPVVVHLDHGKSFLTMIEVHDDGDGILASVVTGNHAQFFESRKIRTTLRDLEDDGRLHLIRGFDNSLGIFQVVDVERADRVVVLECI